MVPIRMQTPQPGRCAPRWSDMTELMMMTRRCSSSVTLVTASSVLQEQIRGTQER